MEMNYEFIFHFRRDGNDMIWWHQVKGSGAGGSRPQHDDHISSEGGGGPFCTKGSGGPGRDLRALSAAASSGTRRPVPLPVAVLGAFARPRRIWEDGPPRRASRAGNAWKMPFPIRSLRFFPKPPLQPRVSSLLRGGGIQRNPTDSGGVPSNGAVIPTPNATSQLRFQLRFPATLVSPGISTIQ